MGTMDKVVIITGAAAGQGAEEARLLSARGCRLVLTDISTSGAEVAEGLGEDAIFVQHDVADERGWKDVVAKAVDRFGRIDALINNAGFYQPASLLDTDRGLWDKLYQVNMLAPYLGMRTVAPVMMQAGTGGSIINVSSLTALRGVAGMFGYVSTKWAVRGMSKSAALDLAPYGIRVNTVLPGPIDTGMLRVNSEESVARMTAMVPLGRVGVPADVANFVAFLISDEASFISGADLTIDGATFA